MLTQNERIEKLSVYQFSHYRDYLAAVLQPNGGYNPGESLEIMAQKLGYKSPSSLSMILTGERLPTVKFLNNFFQIFKLNIDELQYLSLMVKLEEANRKGKDPQPVLHQLEAFNALKDAELLDLKVFKRISQWYFIAIRQLIAIPGQKQDAASLARALKYRVRISQVEEAIETMVELGLMSKNADGVLQNTSKPWRTEKNISSYAIRKFHEGMIEEALHSLKNEEIQQRFITGLSMRFEAQYHDSAVKDVENFLEYFNKKYATSTGDEVKQLNIQLFTLAKSQKDYDQ